MHPEAQALIARLRSHPDDLGAYEALKVHYHSSNDFASLANLVEGWAARSSDIQASADAFHEAARTVSYYLDDQLRAIELLECALDRVANHAEALVDLDQLLGTLGDGATRAASLERRATRLASLGADPVLIASVHFELGELWDKSLARPDRAVVHYRSAYELDPEHVPAMYATREIYRKSGDLRTAAKVYELEIAAEKDSTRSVMLLRELSHLQREGLSDRDASIATLERALELLPRDLEVTYELAGALLARSAAVSDPARAMEDRRRAASFLLRLAQRSDGESQIAFLESALDAAPDYDDALTALELAAPAARTEDRLPIRFIRYLAAAPNGPHATERRKKVASAYEAAGQYDDAIACLEPIAKSDPDVAPLLDALYAKTRGREDESTAPITTTPSTTPPPPAASRSTTPPPAATRTTTTPPPPATAPATEPPAVASLSEAERLAVARATKDYEALRDLLLVVASDTSRTNRERNDAYKEIAQLGDGPLADPGLAIRSREAIVALSPGDRDARAKLKQTMRLGQRWEDLAEILSWEAQNDEDATSQRNAALSLDELTTRAKLDVRRVVVSLDAVHRVIPADTTVRDRLLERRLEAGDMREAIPLIDSKAETADKLAEKTTLFGQSAAIRESLSDHAGAIAVLSRWIDVEPTNAHPKDKALEIAEASGDANLVARVLEKRAEHSEGSERADWLERLAGVRANSLGDPSGAIDALRAATEASNDSPVLRLALERALTEQGRFEELRVSMLTRAGKSEGDERVAILREVARISLDHLSDEAGAVDAHRAIRAVGEDAASLAFLIDHARTRGDEPELIDLLAARCESEPNAPRRAKAVLELAALLDRPDRDTERARVLLESVRNVAPSAKAVLDHLLAIYEARNDEPALGSVIADLIDHEQDERRNLSLAKRLHTLATERLDSEPLTAKALAKWSALAPSELAPLEALVVMHMRAGRESDAGDALVELGKRVDSPSDAEAKLLAATERYEAANDLGAAMEAARLAQRLGFGGRAARDRLGVLAEKASRFDVVLEVEDAKATELVDNRSSTPSAKIEALLVCATVAGIKLLDPRKSEAYVLRASEIAEGHPDLVARVESAAKELDRDTSDAGAMLERALVTRLLDRAKVEEGDARVARIERAAKILSEAIGDHEGAFQLLTESTVEEAPEPLLARWIDVAVRGAKVKDLADALSARFDDAVDGDTARRLLETHANLYRRVRRPSDEADILRRLYTMRATPEVRDRLVDALAHAGRNDDRILVLEQAIRRATDSERDELLRRVARIWDGELNNRHEAVDAWKRVLRFVQGDAEAIAAFERLGARMPSFPPSGARGLDSASVALPLPSRPPASTPLPPSSTSPSIPPPPAVPRLSSLPPPPAPRQSSLPPPPPPSGTTSLSRSGTTSLPQSGLTSLAPLDDLPTAQSTLPPPPSEITDEEVVEDLEEIDALDDVDDLEDLEPLDAPNPRSGHVRQHVSLPPPPPPRGRPQ